MIKIYVIRCNEIPIYVGTTKGSIYEVIWRNALHIKGFEAFDKSLCTVELLENTEDRLRRVFWISHFLEQDAPLLNIYNQFEIKKYEGSFGTSNSKYHHSETGRRKLKEAQARYRQTDRYKKYQKEYRVRKKLEKYGF